MLVWASAQCHHLGTFLGKITAKKKKKKVNSKLFLTSFGFVCVQWRVFIRENTLAIDQ